MTAKLVLLVVTSLIYIGCGDREFDSDVKALVDLQCKGLQIASRVAAGDAPVRAVVDGVGWDTSILRDTKSGRSLLAVLARVRGAKGDGDRVRVEFSFDPDDD